MYKEQHNTRQIGCFNDGLYAIPVYLLQEFIYNLYASKM